MPHCVDIGHADRPGLVATARQRMPLGEHIADRNFLQNRMKGVYYRITMNSAIIALASRMVTIGRGGPSVPTTTEWRLAHDLPVPSGRRSGSRPPRRGLRGRGAIAARFVSGAASRTSEDLDFEITPLNEVLLTWAAPDPEPGRAPVTGYEVYLEGEARPVGVTGSLSYLYRGLVPGRTYVFHVRAVNRVGRSQAAGTVTVTVTAVPFLSPPGPPGSLRAELTPSNEAFLQWTAPAPVAGRAPVTGYVVYRELPGGDYEELGETESLSYVHPNLAPGESYVFTVRASSDAGLSGASASAFVGVAPLLPPAPPGNFTAELTPNNEALLQWTPPTPAAERAPVTGYVVYVESPGSRLLQLDDTEALSYLHSALLQGVSYVYHVRARSDSGLSQPSASASVHVAIGALVRLVAPHVTVQADEGAGRAVISWVHRAQSPDAGVPTAVSEFSLQYCEVSTGQTSDHCLGGWNEFEHMSLTTPAARQVVDTAISCNSGTGARMYRMRAVADNDSLSSRYSEPTPPVCPSDDYAPPRRVTAVFATPPEADVELEQRVNVCWNAPLSNGNPVTGYELHISPDADIPSTEDGWLTVDSRIDADAVPTPVCILYSGVVANQIYWFRVRAYNHAGHGNWSAPYQYRHGEEFVPPQPAPARASVQSDSALTVTDTRAREGTDAALTFEVTLDRPPSVPVTVDYATADGTATADEDYRATSGTLELAARRNIEDHRSHRTRRHGGRGRGDPHPESVQRRRRADRRRRSDGHHPGPRPAAEGVARALRADRRRSGGGRGRDTARIEAGPARPCGWHVDRLIFCVGDPADAEPGSGGGTRIERVGPSRRRPQPLATGAPVRKLVPSRLGRRRTGLRGMGPLRDRGLRGRRARHAAGRRHHHRVPGSGRHGRPLAHGRGGLAQRSGRLVRSGERRRYRRAIAATSRAPCRACTPTRA